MGGNITIAASPIESLTWEPAGRGTSLEKVCAYVEAEALKAATWYLTAKRSKARLSQAIRMSAIVATALAGLLPIALSLWPAARPWLALQTGAPSASDLLASLLVGLAAALLGVDRAFGFSTGWIRYILTASAIRKALEEFRLDWALLAAKASIPPEAAQVEEMLRRAREFRSAIEGYVIQETKDWATEFQSNLAQIEKDAQAQLDALKAQIDRDTKATQESSRPSALELTVTNAHDTDKGFTVVLEGVTGQLAQEHVETTDVWSRLALAPGQYKLTVSATAGGKPVSTSKIVVLGAAAIVTVAVTLPAPKP